MHASSRVVRAHPRPGAGAQHRVGRSAKRTHVVRVHTRTHPKVWRSARSGRHVEYSTLIRFQQQTGSGDAPVHAARSVSDLHHARIKGQGRAGASRPQITRCKPRPPFLRSTHARRPPGTFRSANFQTFQYLFDDLASLIINIISGQRRRRGRHDDALPVVIYI